MSNPFCHLHVHTHYSLLEGLGKPEQFVAQAKKLGQTALAITDSGNLYGAIEFYKAAKKNDIHPVIGVEFYLALNKRTDRRPKIDQKTHHLILLAKNKKGYENLLQLVTRSHLEGFYFRPRADFELLEEHAEGLLCLTSDLRGIVSHYLLAGMPEEASASLKRLQTIYGQEQVFVEIQNHPNIENQCQLNPLLIDLANTHHAPLVATNDVRYITTEDAEAHEVLLCIRDNRLITDEQRARFADDFSFLSSEQMKKNCAEYPKEVLENTMMIANQCHVDFEFGINLIPPFHPPSAKSPTEFLRELVIEGLIQRYRFPCTVNDLLQNKTDHLSLEQKEMVSRMNYELTTINAMGFDEYFLIVWDFIRYAKEQGILVGPGRGSAAGALIAYCLNITDIDPLKYDLLFERFLNPDRISMPDIDIDFEDDRRTEILQYVTNKYGRDKVAQVITFGTLAAKASVKDAGRVFGIPFQEMNQLTKLIPGKPGTKLAQALKTESELKAIYRQNAQYKKILDTALKLEGTVRQAGVHACAVIISKDPLLRHTPLQKAPGDDDSIITQYSMKPLEDLGLLKMDFLGLRNLTLLKKANAILKKRHITEIDFKDLPMDDKQTFELLSEAKTTGVFQLESSGMKRYLKELKPSSFEDIIAMGALYRPGPMQFIPDYIDGKHGHRQVKYVHDDLKPILERTYGIAVYQEQILQIARKFAGFSLGEADLLRRAIGKKISSELKAQREKFIRGSIRQGYARKLAIDIFDTVIEPFANYGFNKSHAACYALISYQTAYLKAHYPSEFMAALLSCDQENIDRVIIDISECEAMGIRILPPDINESFESFTVIDDNHIRYGFSAIKNLGTDVIVQILASREHQGPFQDLADFLHRLPEKCLNKKSMEALIMSGALDRFSDRNRLMHSLDVLCDYARGQSKKKSHHQSDLFTLLKEQGEHHPLELKKGETATWFQKLQWEKQALGIFASDHPLKGLRGYLKRKGTLIGQINASMNQQTIHLGGIIHQLRKLTTKKGETMLVLELEDQTGKINVVVFPKVYEQIKDTDMLDEGTTCFLFVEGRIDYRAGELQCVARSIKKLSIPIMRENAISERLFNPSESTFLPVKEPKPSFEENTELLRFILHDHITAQDLTAIRNILQQYQGSKPIRLNILIEGHRKDIDPGILIQDLPTLRQSLSPYLQH